MAPEDDEPVTAEDLATLAEAQAESERGELIFLEDLIADETAGR